MTYCCDILVQVFNRIKIIAIIDVNLNQSSLIAVRKVTVRDQLRYCNTIKITNRSTKFGGVWSKMKKTIKKLHMSKKSRIKCHQLLKWNKKKEQDTLS